MHSFAIFDLLPFYQVKSWKRKIQFLVTKRGQKAYSARRANFFSAVGKIFNLVSGFRKAKKWAQNRNWNENLPCIEDIARWMSKKRTMDVSDPCKNLGYDDRCWNHWLRKESNVVQLWMFNECFIDVFFTFTLQSVLHIYIFTASTSSCDVFWLYLHYRL